MLTRRLVLVPLALVALLSAASCTSKSDEPEVAFTIPGSSTSSTASVPTTPTTVAYTCDPQTVTPPAADQKPTVEVPTGDAPTELVATDLVVGTGATAQAGDKVAVEYVGVLYDGGTQFDASWDRGAEPFEFTLGQGEVITGWDQGVEGMQVGGRRQLVIPADLAYGEAGAGSDIPPNATLVFVVDLLQVCTPDTTATTPPVSIDLGGDASTTTTAATGAGEATTTTTAATTTSAG